MKHEVVSKILLIAVSDLHMSHDMYMQPISQSRTMECPVHENVLVTYFWNFPFFFLNSMHIAHCSILHKLIFSSHDIAAFDRDCVCFD